MSPDELEVSYVYVDEAPYLGHFKRTVDVVSGTCTYSTVGLPNRPESFSSHTI